MNSKLDLRIEAVKIAVNVEGVTPENVIETAKAIEDYIIGDIELPEWIDAQSQWKELSEKFLTKPFEPKPDEEADKETASEESVAE